jgi:hypothetical protein
MDASPMSFTIQPTRRVRKATNSFHISTHKTCLFILEHEKSNVMDTKLLATFFTSDGYEAFH